MGVIKGGRGVDWWYKGERSGRGFLGGARSRTLRYSKCPVSQELHRLASRALRQAQCDTSSLRSPSYDLAGSRRCLCDSILTGLFAWKRWLDYQDC